MCSTCRNNKPVAICKASLALQKGERNWSGADSNQHAQPPVYCLSVFITFLIYSRAIIPLVKIKSWKKKAMPCYFSPFFFKVAGNLFLSPLFTSRPQGKLRSRLPPSNAFIFSSSLPNGGRTQVAAGWARTSEPEIRIDEMCNFCIATFHKTGNSAAWRLERQITTTPPTPQVRLWHSENREIENTNERYKKNDKMKMGGGGSEKQSQ